MIAPLDLQKFENQPNPTASAREVTGSRSGHAPKKPKGLYLMDEATLDAVYGPEERLDLAQLIDIEEGHLNDLSRLAETEILISSWGSPVMDEAFLEKAPRLKAVFYGAGSVRPIAPPTFWKRDITISSAYAANAFPVAEYTLGAILLSLKKFWNFAAAVKAENDPWGNHTRHVSGAYQSTIGLVSVGMIARRVIELLKSFDLRCIVYCPFLTEESAAELGVERASLRDVFRRSDVVSIHTPMLPETAGLITGELISSMKEGATLINTARGGVVQETEMIEVLRRRSDLSAILDVCNPEPPVPNSPLVRLPNVILTPHISGSLGPECRRLGRCMVEELSRYLAGKPLRWRITEELAAKLA
jgi:phosphoglycerate dehydrogenase-like enzyme